MRYYTLSLLLMGLCICLPVLNGQTRTTGSKEAQLTCVVDFDRAPMTPYGFAMATLKSLGSARDAVSDGTREIDESQKADNPLAIVTGMMRSFKLSTNDLICAKRAVQPFTSKAAFRSLTPDQRDQITLAATFIISVYDKKIGINERALQAVKNFMDGGNMAKFSDQISTLQVESGEVWNDLIPPVGMSVLLLIDMRATDENGNFIKTSDPNAGYTKRLLVTKAQKRAFLDWMNEHFPELRDDTPEDKITEPAKTAKLYMKAFEGRKCSDE